jgi:hypothetical protein
MKSTFIFLFITSALTLNSLKAQSVFNRIEIGFSAQAVSENIDLNASPNEMLGSLRFSPALVMRYNMPYRFAIRATFSELDRGVNSFIAILGEFHFNDYNIYRSKTPVVPYLGLGLSFLSGLYDTNSLKEPDFNPSAIFSFGAKMKHNRLVVSTELASGVRIANRDKSLLNDWYVFPNFTITYTFGPNF